MGLLVLAALTPPEWEIRVIDENLDTPDYSAMPRPDLVGITAFTSQAHRAYEIAASFRSRGVTVVMGGIHASACTEEALQYADAVVSSEAESVWTTVLDDTQHGRLKNTYVGRFLSPLPSVLVPLAGKNSRHAAPRGSIASWADS